MSSIKVTFLGTGTSQGVPIIGCSCNVCSSKNSKDNRLRTSILVQSPLTTIVIDTGPDFRYQMLREKVKTLDAVVFTHGHKDHIAGMDDIRAYNYFQNKAIDVYADARTQEALRREFVYIFDGTNYPGIPQINLIDIQAHSPIHIQDITIEPFYVMHYKLPVLGFKINEFVYITDANHIDNAIIDKIKYCDVLVLNALRHEKHISHFTLSEAIDITAMIQPRKAYYTHISHQLGLHDEVISTLPKHITLAYDGLSIEI